MKQIVIISGKGGTGKTVITASFAVLAKSKVMADCDVDAADLHILLHPTIKERHEFKSSKTAVINQDKCTQCGKCIKVCRFGAIQFFGPQTTDNSLEKKNYGLSTMDCGLIIDSISCEGCGVCFHICPEKAIELKENQTGEWFISDTKYGPMIHAKLGIAEENSGKLVTLVRQNAKLIAEKENKEYIIIDGPPGIGCPVIASLSGVDLAIIVTEPTLSGIHDLDRVNKVALHFGVKSTVCINKYDLNIENTNAIRKYCMDSKIEIIGEIPFSSIVAKSLVECKPVVEFTNNIVSEKIRNMWKKIEKSFN
jgi:MinD superfamily P-loop ATPase